MKQKIAILSDIHGNSTALEAVIRDAKREQATEYWLLGDLIMPGPGGHEIFEMLSQLNITVNIRGNWEDLFFKTLNHTMTLERPSRVFFARTAEYTASQLTQSDLDFLEAQTLTAEKNINGIRFAISHALPEKNHGQELIATAPVENFRPLFRETEIDVAIYGHIHHQLMRYSENEQLIINPGSIGEPFFHWAHFRKDLRAQYTLIEVDDAGYTDVHFKKVAYNREKEFVLAEARDLPYLELYRELLDTGIIHTHDYELMDATNKKYHYVEDVKKFYGK